MKNHCSRRMLGAPTITAARGGGGGGGSEGFGTVTVLERVIKTQMHSSSLCVQLYKQCTVQLQQTREGHPTVVQLCTQLCRDGEGKHSWRESAK